MSTRTTNLEFTKHPHFDLMLPSDDSLSSHVGAAVVQREVCHEWPLSCVERVTFAGNIEKYCKTIRPPSLEIEAYMALESPLLVPFSVVAQSESSSTLLLDSFHGKPLSRKLLETEGIPSVINLLREQLSSISGNGPVFIDLSTVDNVREHFAVMVERLDRLFGGVRRPGIEPNLLAIARDSCMSDAVQRAFVEDVVYSNGDLSSDNILVLDGEMRILDWQFPRRTSLRVESVNLLSTAEIDPRGFFPDPVVAASLLCTVRWFAECADVWFVVGDYSGLISALLRQIERLQL
jgi:hypothetical protein